MSIAVSKPDSASRVGAAVWACLRRAREQDPAFRLTEAALIDCLRPALAIEFPKAKASHRVNGRDLLFDAICTACELDVNGLTREAAKQVATAKRDILEATPDVTPEDIAQRGEAWRRKYPTIRGCSPMALAKHWPALGTNGGALTRGARKDNYVEPVGWKTSEAAKKALFVSDETWALIVARGWFDLAVDIRSVILKAMP